MNILLTGATGLIGSQLGIELVKRGHTLFAVTRNRKKAQQSAPFPATWIECDLQTQTLPREALKNINGVIHLAGENVGESKWSEQQKKNILDSRTLGTKNLIDSLQGLDLQFFSSASAIGYYGTNNEGATEQTTVGSGFLSEVTDAWEKEVLKLKNAKRLCIFRIGVVLSTEGGALPKMLFPAQIFASSALGSGQQWMSWVHIADVVKAFAESTESENMTGLFNLVSPNPCQQKTLAQGIARELKAFNGPPVPGFVLSLMLGEQASLATNSLKVLPQSLLKIGFQFLHPDLSAALADILSGWQNGVSVKYFRQYFDIPVDKVFPFFAEAQNLEKITPDFLHFRILKMSTEQIEKGTLLDYSIKVHGIPLKWRTQIETWNPPQSFTDTQLKGPYSLWHHTHSFESLGQGTLMTDTVRYKLPLGQLGRLAAQAIVNNDVEKIFAYRRQVVSQYL